MTCDQYCELLSARIDNELTVAEEAALNEHLAQCAECAQYEEQLRELERLTVEWEETVLPPEVEEAILSKPDTKSSGWVSRLFRGSYSVPRPLAWVAVIVFLLLAANTLLDRPSGGSSDRLIITPEDNQPVQKIILTEAEVVRTLTAGTAGADL